MAAIRRLGKVHASHSSTREPWRVGNPRGTEVHCRANSGQGGHMAEAPSRGLADVVAASTALSDIDGRAGLLFYRGYDINDLAGQASFEEVAFLLQRGRAPDGADLEDYRAELAA